MARLGCQHGFKLLIDTVQHLIGDVHPIVCVAGCRNALQTFDHQLQYRPHLAQACLGGLDPVRIRYHSFSHLLVTSFDGLGRARLA